MAKQKFKKDEIANALRENKGFLSYTATALRCDVKTIAKYLKRYPDLDEIRKEMRESLLDFAEQRLLSNMKNGKEASLIFFLKTQGKKRGYIEKNEIDLQGDLRIVVGLPPEMKDPTA